ncbi:MAG: helix-turn-helix domain-containing protein [Ruminococcaceae bacterium]|nr:helix-turn-helix domain-containing protein [Oscillospiraceae bacterium]
MTHEIYTSGKMPKTSVLAVGCAEEVGDTRSGPIKRNVFVIHYCLAGKGYFLGNPVSAGQGFFFLPGDTVEYHPSKHDPWKYLWFIIDTESPDFFLKHYNADPKTKIFTYDFVDIIEEQYRAVKRSKDFSISPVEGMLTYLNILKHHSAQKGGGKATVYAMSAREYIETNYHLHPSIASLAGYLNISQSYLYRVFFEEFGMSPKEYLNRFCMEQAKMLLRSSDMNISQIAAAVGYSDVLAFSAFFSKRKGCSPTAYRERTKKSDQGA